MITNARQNYKYLLVGHFSHRQLAPSVGTTPCVHAFGHQMAHLSAIFVIMDSNDTTRFGSLEFPTLPPVGMWVPPIFEPSQTFIFGSLNFVADRLGVLHLREEALVPPTNVGTPSDLNNETPALRSEPTLGSNPTVSNIHIVLYSLFNIFRRLSGGTPLSPLRPSCA